MKQHITPEQLNELSEKGRERLRKWWKPDFDTITYYDAKTDKKVKSEPLTEHLPLLSIGQMIEFLGDLDWFVAEDALERVFVDDMYPDHTLLMASPGTYCDALWEAVKEELEREFKGGKERKS